MITTPPRGAVHALQPDANALTEQGPEAHSVTTERAERAKHLRRFCAEQSVSAGWLARYWEVSRQRALKLLKSDNGPPSEKLRALPVRAQRAIGYVPSDNLAKTG